MICRIGRGAVILALCFSLGLHWLALQSVAWATMLLSNARHGSLTEAVEKTFDGAHPCDLCHAVLVGKKSEKRTDTLPLVVKWDFICPPRVCLWQPPAAPYEFAPLSFPVTERAQAPPGPPPRFFLS